MAEKKDRQRVTKAALREFIAECENDLLGSGEQIPMFWNDLRQFAGLDEITRRDLLAREVEVARRIEEDYHPQSIEGIQQRQHRLALERDLLAMDTKAAEEDEGDG